VPPNKGMKLSKPGYLEGIWPVRLTIIESGFAAYAQCSTDRSRNPELHDANGLWWERISGLARPGRGAESRVMPRLEQAGSEEFGGAEGTGGKRRWSGDPARHAPFGPWVRETVLGGAPALGGRSKVRLRGATWEAKRMGETRSKGESRGEPWGVVMRALLRERADEA
jgi:hypothetical protein